MARRSDRWIEDHGTVRDRMDVDRAVAMLEQTSVILVGTGLGNARGLVLAELARLRLNEQRAVEVATAGHELQRRTFRVSG